MLLNHRVRQDAAPQWHDLGEKLLMETLTQKLHVIGEKYKGDDMKCCSEMFGHWLGDCFSATWSKLLDLLEQNDYNDVVTTVKGSDDIKG